MRILDSIMKVLVLFFYVTGALLIVPELIVYEIVYIRTVFTNFGSAVDPESFSSYPLAGIHYVLHGYLTDKIYSYVRVWMLAT